MSVPCTPHGNNYNNNTGASSSSGGAQQMPAPGAGQQTGVVGQPVYDEYGNMIGMNFVSYDEYMQSGVPMEGNLKCPGVLVPFWVFYFQL